MAKRLGKQHEELVRFCFWLLTMSQEEAAIISRLTYPIKDDKAKVSAFTVAYWKGLL